MGLMRTVFPGVLVAAAVAVSSTAHAHTVVRGGGKPIEIAPGACEVVARPDVFTYKQRNSTYLWTAIVATNHLSRALGAAVPIVTNPTPGKVSVILDADRAKAAGLAPEKLPRDAFQIKTRRRPDGGADVFVTGVDDPDHCMAANILLSGGGNDYEHATLFGVYELLERYAGVRFYFPGELGTIYRGAAFSVPEDLSLESWPDYKVRYYSCPGEQGAWYEPIDRMEDCRNRAAMRLRHRMETEHIPCCHGQNQLSPAKRFRKTHPEYFRLDEKGQRSWLLAEESKAEGFDDRVEQMCQTSAWWKEMELDAISYFRGEDASVRKIPAFPHRWKGGPEFAWGPNAVGRRYFDVMPQDGLHKCCCATCQAAYAKAKNPKAWATEIVWGQTAKLARAVKDAGLKGTICQMVYGSYRDVPDFDLPDNIAVMVGTVGPWSEAQPEVLARQNGEVKAWGRKLGGKVFLWTYVGKYNCLYLDIPDVPHAAPHAFGRYYKSIAQDTIGAYAESLSDRYLYHYLDFHLFAKIAWDSDVDPEALIAEHDRLMFGAGAAKMRAFFDILEHKWVYEIAGHTVPTPLGDVANPPDEYNLWNHVFSKDVMKRLHALVTGALAAVPEGSLEARRIKVMKEEFLNRMGRRASAYWKRTSVQAELARRKASKAENLFRRELIYIPETCSQKKELCATDEGYVLHLTEKEVHTWPAVCVLCSPKRGVALKPATRYRFSYFAKTDGIKPVLSNGGHFVQVRGPAGYQKQFPERTQVSGSFGWTHFAYEFTTPADLPTDDPKEYMQVALRAHGATGDIWFDGLWLEELASKNCL